MWGLRWVGTSAECLVAQGGLDSGACLAMVMHNGCAELNGAGFREVRAIAHCVQSVVQKGLIEGCHLRRQDGSLRVNRIAKRTESRQTIRTVQMQERQVQDEEPIT